MNKKIKQLMSSFALGGKITEGHAQEIETTLTEALKERDELLETASKIMSGYIMFEFIDKEHMDYWLTKYKLLDKE